MPANIVNIENSKRHNTKSEIDARTQAQESLSRKRVTLKMPALVKAHPNAAEYWKQIIKDAKEVVLYDNFDVQTLGRYCMALDRLDQLYESIDDYNLRIIERSESADSEETPVLDIHGIYMRIEATERNILAYAEKLGLTPSSRARLAKKRADALPPDPDDDLYGG